MKCPECGKELYMNVNVSIDLPSSMESQLSKSNIRKKEVEIISASWDSSYYFCKTKNCKIWRS